MVAPDYAPKEERLSPNELAKKLRMLIGDDNVKHIKSI